MEALIQKLHASGASLVVAQGGNITTYHKKGVRDLVWLLDHDPNRLCGAAVADKVVGKAAAGLMVRGGVGSVYADVMSRAALPLLEAAHIPYRYGLLVEKIIIPEGDTRCPLEEIVAQATDAVQVETMLRKHFAEMQQHS